MGCHNQARTPSWNHRNQIIIQSKNERKKRWSFAQRLPTIGPKTLLSSITIFKYFSNFIIDKGTLPFHLSTVYFSHLSYIRDQLRKCIHISKPLIVISSCCRWNKQIIIFFDVFLFFYYNLKCDNKLKIN